MMQLEPVLKEFGLDKNSVNIASIDNGLINHTWKVGYADEYFILQRVNTSIFQQPEDIAHNISEISSYLQHDATGYTFVSPVKTFEGEALVYFNEQGYFRVFPFVKGSHTIKVVQTPEQATEAAKQFGRFTKLLNGLDCSKLKITIPDFHNLSLRYKQFTEALTTGNSDRISDVSGLIDKLKDWSPIVDEYEAIKNDGAFKFRVTHHDTKISNVLFDNDDKGICVIDLDTVMPGYFISDVGDMMRTYLCPVSEEEQDVSKIEIRPAFYKAIVKGYLSEMQEVLTVKEKGYFFYAGLFMIYMQALRFLTDYLNDDKYYGAAYPGQNLTRASNQIVLLQKFIEAKPVLQNIGMNS